MLTISRRAATPRLGRHRHRHRYVGAVAVIAALLGALGSASNAMAAAPGQKSASGPGSTSASGPGFAITGTVLGTSRRCTSHWNWKVFHNPVYGSDDYSKVEWTSNPCGFAIQDQSWCFEGTGASYDSGIVTRTYLWDQANCTFTYPDIWKAQQRFRNGGSWSAWKTYWGG